MKIVLKGDPLTNRSDIFYAKSVEDEIIDPETRRITQKYNINSQELILIGAKPLSSFKVKLRAIPSGQTPPKERTAAEADSRRLILLKFILKGKRIYFSRLFTEIKEPARAEKSESPPNGDYFEFSQPEQLAFEIENPDNKKLKKINERFNKKQKAASLSKAHIKIFTRYLAEINKETLKGLLNSAKRDLDFIIRFNGEMFHHNLSLKNSNLTKEAVAGIYEQDRYTKIIDLSDVGERIGFISLYAITFMDLSLNDLYSVEGIFALQPNREADDKKRLAGREVFELVYSENKNEIQNRVLKMAETIKNLPLPAINVNINGAIKQNYTLCCGIGDIGRAFSRVILEAPTKNEAIILEEAIKTARKISVYKKLEKYYDGLLNNQNPAEFEKSDLYKEITALASAADGKKTAGELK